MRSIATSLLTAFALAFALSACATTQAAKPKTERIASLPVCISDAFCTIAPR